MTMTIAERQESPVAETRVPVYPFHLSCIVNDLEQARRFYTSVLGRPELRCTPTSLHLDFFGSQLTLHGVAGFNAAALHREVDAEIVPVPHFGAALTLEMFHDVAKRLREANYTFVLEPHIRFAGKPFEHWVLFILDPSGNAIEMKHFTQIGEFRWT
jgi:extradiol dioxygenase family protein